MFHVEPTQAGLGLHAMAETVYMAGLTQGLKSAYRETTWYVSYALFKSSDKSSDGSHMNMTTLSMATHKPP